MAILNTDDWKMKPMMILPPDMISQEDIALLRTNGICVVVASNPSAVRFVDPIPAMAQRTKIEDAAIQLSKKLLDKKAYVDWRGMHNDSISLPDVCRLYVDLLVTGTPLDPNPSPEEARRNIFEEEKQDELRKIAREEAREEAKKRKAEKAASEKAKT